MRDGQAKKLGLKAGQRVALDQPPPGWSLADPPAGLAYVDATEPADVTLSFFTSAAQMPGRLPGLARRIGPGDALWVAWPRRAGGHCSDITDSAVRQQALALGLVDVKIAAIDNDWSGLRFVRRPAPAVIVLNGGSSSGKSTIAHALQALLPDPWLTFGVDTLVDALPPEGSEAGRQAIAFHPDGSISLGPSFRALEDAWMAGVAAMARAGAHIILDEVFLSGGEGQARWQKALDGLPVLWVGVRCDPAVAEAREAARGDRIAGMARSQATQVHEGVTYDLEVDTSATDAATCARMIGAHTERAR